LKKNNSTTTGAVGEPCRAGGPGSTTGREGGD